VPPSPEPSAQPPPSAPASPPGPPERGSASAAAVTDLLLAWSGGDRAAFDALVPAVYTELRRQAQRALRRESAGHTLQPTALVHEAYLRLVDQRRAQWASRTQFFAVAAQLMRRVLVDHARARRAAKRGRGARNVTLTDAGGAGPAEEELAGVDVLALDDALSRLASLDPERAHLVDLRYFAGLTIPEAAASLGISEATVGRQWAVARAWLRRELTR
jgi:RNA polymerase sigma factor (TIGR02999 family)